MSDTKARVDSITRTVTVIDGTAIADVTFPEPLPDVDYEVFFQQQQGGTYDVWATERSTAGFKLNLAPAASGNLVVSYFAVMRSYGDHSGVALIQSLNPVAWFRYGQGITSSGGAVSQWDDRSGNGRHLKQATATNQPALQTDLSILFDGVDNYLKCDAFTLNQPVTIYVLGKQITWTASEYLWDGDDVDTGGLRQRPTSPGLGLVAPTLGVVSNDLALDTYGAICAVYNGANSVLQISNSAAVTGDAGANNMGGFILGAARAESQWSHSQFKEAILLADAHDADTRYRIIQYLLSL